MCTVGGWIGWIGTRSGTARRPGIPDTTAPPHTHRSLKAEHAIRTFKNHFIATLCTAATDFPPTIWDDMPPQMEIYLNHLLPYPSNVTVSAYAGLNGGAFDFSKHTIALIGTRLLIHDKPTARASWTPHGVSGFYLGPTLQHYHSYRAWSTATNTLSRGFPTTWPCQALPYMTYSFAQSMTCKKLFTNFLQPLRL